MKSSIRELVYKTANALKDHSAHIFRNDFQYFMRKQLTEGLPMDCALAIMDFSENITIEPQDAIESCHWEQKQTILHPIPVVRHSPGSTEDDPKLLKESPFMRPFWYLLES